MTAGRRDRMALSFWAAAFFVFSFDLASKAWVKRTVSPGSEPVNVVGEAIRLRHLQNSGGLFGIFPGNAAYFAVVSVVAVAVILYLVYRSDYCTWPPRVALGLILGGALGNFLDRIRYQAVVDFVDVGFGGFRLPTFNVADAGVTVGVWWLAWWLFRADPALAEREQL